MNSVMNSVPSVRFPRRQHKATSARSAGQEVCRRRGSCRSSRRGRAVPRHVRRQGRGGEVCVSVCVSLLCASVCLSGQDSSRVLRPLRTPGRARAGAVTRSAQHARHALCAQLGYIGQGGQVGEGGQGGRARQIRKANPQGKSTRQIHKANPWGREGDFIFFHFAFFIFAFLIRFSHSLSH